MAAQHVGQYCTSDCAAGLWTFIPRHHPFVPVEWEFCVAKFPFPIQAVHTLFKTKGVSWGVLYILQIKIWWLG